jgi:hypothetical protein
MLTLLFAALAIGAGALALAVPKDDPAIDARVPRYYAVAFACLAALCAVVPV